jgi:hypothetical protein
MDAEAAGDPGGEARGDGDTPTFAVHPVRINAAANNKIKIFDFIEILLAIA